MKSRNIKYKTKELVNFYGEHRKSWVELYASERWVFEKVAQIKGSLGDVLDVGCACGGLVRALGERSLGMTSYHGIDINRDVIELAKQSGEYPVLSTFSEEDIVTSAKNKSYDTVVSLGCADWNIETSRIIASCWDRVRVGGYLIISLRLTPDKSINDITQSHQRICFDNNAKSDSEIANYVVMNASESLNLFRNMHPCPDIMGAYGYWGEPSPAAHTPYSKLVFAVFYLRKPLGACTDSIRTELYLPSDLQLSE